jgi:hypothetical protein
VRELGLQTSSENPGGGARKVICFCELAEATNLFFSINRFQHLRS